MKLLFLLFFSYFAYSHEFYSHGFGTWSRGRQHRGFGIYRPVTSVYFEESINMHITSTATKCEDRDMEIGETQELCVSWYEIKKIDNNFCTLKEIVRLEGE